MVKKTTLTKSKSELICKINTLLSDDIDNFLSIDSLIRSSKCYYGINNCTRLIPRFANYGVLLLSSEAIQRIEFFHILEMCSAFDIRTYYVSKDLLETFKKNSSCLLFKKLKKSEKILEKSRFSIDINYIK